MTWRRRAAGGAALLLAAALTGCGSGAKVDLDGPAYRDAFTTPSGWPVSPRIAYADGALQLTALRTREAVYGALPKMERDFRSMTVAAQVQITEGGVAGAGLTCRTGTDLRSPELYGFIVTADGAAQILRADRRGIRTLALGEVPGGGAAVRAGVRVEARCLRQDLTLLVDGRELLTASTQSVKSGRVGVVLLAGTDARARVRIDDLVARTAV